MKRSFAFVLSALALCWPQQGRAEDSLTSYTEQLVKLVGLFSELDQTVADRMNANERYIMAKHMLRLSSNFYYLMLRKDDLMRAVYKSAMEFHGSSPDLYSSTVFIKSELRCLSKSLQGDGARIGALVGFDGPSVEEGLRITLQNKILNIDDLVYQLGLGHNSPDLKQLIINDAEAAHKASHTLYVKTAEFAHVLDPSVIPPEKPDPTIRCD